jgi:hypothetical protein
LCGGRAYTGVIHCVFDQIPNLQNYFTTQINTCRQVTFQVKFKKSRFLGFGIFVVIWSIVCLYECVPGHLSPLCCGVCRVKQAAQTCQHKNLLTFKNSKIQIILLAVFTKLRFNESGLRSSFRGLKLGKMLYFFLLKQV